MAHVDELVEELVREGKVCHLNDNRGIITDRMGSWGDQKVDLVWEGCNDVMLTPDEAEILFERGLTSNVLRLENGSLGMKFVYCDARYFSGAIVCGVLAPGTKEKMRPEIVEYAKKMEYVTDTMTPVQMTSGVKSLIFNPDGTYSVFYEWNACTLKNIKKSLRNAFTKRFFSRQTIEIKDDGVLMTNLSEAEVFSRKNIDLFRVYDIQLHYLSQEYDKELLLLGLLKRAFIYDPYNILYRGDFENSGDIVIPRDRYKPLNFNEYGKLQMSSGNLYRGVEDEHYEYTYKITVPYSEAIRELMSDTEKILNAMFAGKNVVAHFSGFREDISLVTRDKSDIPFIERELLALDYAITLLRTEAEYNGHQLRRSIIYLLGIDSIGRYKNVYEEYIALLKRALPEKFERMSL